MLDAVIAVITTQHLRVEPDGGIDIAHDRLYRSGLSADKFIGPIKPLS